ncbi:MAG: 1-aminocyclopropane-1-carboxylate deaminase/D-cysteine desulfhydrase [Anaerolineae bacterium]
MAEAIISAKALKERVQETPRVKLAALPTPLQECAHFSKVLGGPRIFVKREDLTGLAFGGNKVRKLELFMAELVSQGVETVVAGASKQSNFCRQVSACAAKLGMKAVLVLMGDPDTERQGNLLVDDLLGADIRLQNIEDWPQLHETMHQLAEDLRSQGVKVRALTGFEPLGSIAYVDCVLEMLPQFEEHGIQPDYLFVCSGTGTQAGLEVGVRALGLDCKVIGVSPSAGLSGYDSISHRLAEVANWVADRLGLGLTFKADEITNTPDYVGEGYAKVTEAGIEAIRLFARTEGILLDPVYTGKAMAGLIDYIRRGEIGPEKTVVFVHTGGTPALFAYQKELVQR